MSEVAAPVQTVNITVNGVELQVPKGELIIESVKRLGVEVPIFCYHPRLKPVGMCRMCLVEVASKMPDGTIRKMPKPQTACSLPATEGLQVVTDTEAVHKDRRGVLEFLLINHPLDCPICDRGGECPLQNNTLFYGPSTSRFVENKRHAPKAYPLSQFVKLDLERCIQCGRCVRFTEEISGDASLALRFRGARTQPGTFELGDFDSKFSGNTIEICPVGALTSAKYRFKARPWDLQTKPGLCTLCAVGCNVYMDYRIGELARVNGRINEAVNEEWTCDKGKFGHYDLQAQPRLDTPLVRRGDMLQPADWAVAYADVLAAFADGQRVAGLSGGFDSVQGLGGLRDLFTWAGLDYRWERDLDHDVPSDDFELAALETAPAIGMFGTDLSDNAPVAFLRVRKAWFLREVPVVVAHELGTDADTFANVVLRYNPGTGALVAAALAGEMAFADAAAATGVHAADLEEAARLLQGAPIISSRAAYDAENGAGMLAALRRFADASGGKLIVAGRRVGEPVAAKLGLPLGMDTHDILRAAAAGEIDALWLAGVDPFELHPDRVLVTAALENVSFLVVQDWRRTEAHDYASVVLPTALPHEMDGSYMNIEGRVQTMDAVLTPKSLAKPTWRVYEEIALRRRPRTPSFTAGEAMGRLGSLRALNR